MKDEWLVLGWTACDAGRCAGVTVKNAGLLDLLLCPTDTKPDDRLRLQVRCFAKGLEFIPTAPAEQISLASGATLAVQHHDHILNDLSDLSGKGQLTLTFTWCTPPRSKTCPSTGRKWLRQRHHHVTHAQHIKDRAAELLTQMANGHPTAPVQERSHSVGTAILIDRSELSLVRDGLRVKAGTFTEHDLSVTVSGLWPAFSFVKPFSATSRHAA